MQLKLSKVNVYRTESDLVIGEFCNPMTNCVQSIFLGVFKAGQYDAYFKENNFNIIVQKQGESNATRFRTPDFGEDYDEPQEYYYDD